MGCVLLRHWYSCANVPKTLHVSLGPADVCISTMAFNAIVAELYWFVEVMGSNANKAKAWRETCGVEYAWTFTAREWTILVNPELRLEQIVEKGTRADVKLCGLAERKCAFWFLMVIAKTSVLEVATIYWNWVWLMLVFAIDFGNCQLQQLGDQSLHRYLADVLKIPALIFYHGIAHAIEHLLNKWSCLEALHPASAHCRLLEIFSVKGWLEALHPNPFVWLVRVLIRDLVHSLDCSLVAVIKSNNWPKLDFQLPSQDLWMHLHDLLKERLPIAPRTLKELSFHSILFVFNASMNFF
jgi:hypothetical protein